MSYRNTRGNNPANSSNSNLYNRRYGTRRNESSEYNQPVYSTQSGYQPPQNSQQTFSSGFETKPQTQAVGAASQKFKSPQQIKEEIQPVIPPANATQQQPPAPVTQPASDSTPMIDDDDDKLEKPWKKKNFQKLPKKVRKKRLNAKLRNLLAPKNAMMVLHELHPGISCHINEEGNSGGQMSFSVVIDISGKQYRGQGLSKAQAKQTACENALKAALLEKMEQSSVKIDTPEVQAMDTAETTESITPSNGETPSESGKSRKPPEEDDVPWGSLASYALFKLFSEWQSQGYSLPSSPGKPVQPNLNVVPNTMMPMKKMPPDAAQRHPVQLLNQLKPHCRYFESRDGNPPNMVFTFTASFDGQTFSGTGPNKKDAKKQCAKNALVSMGIQYTE